MFYLQLITSLLSIIQFLKHVQCGHELSDDSEKAKLNLTDPDSQPNNEKTTSRAVQLFSDL